MKVLTHPLLFDDVWEYLDFRRHKSEVSRTSPNGLMTATLRQHGGWFSYTLMAGDDGRISTTFDVFRATAVRLHAFHLGCARIALHMRRYLRTGDREWLTMERPFGALHGGILSSGGGYMWRGTKDDIDTDVWIDMVEDEALARVLDRVDRLLSEGSGRPDEEGMRKRAWELLETVPKNHQENVEVLRRRLKNFACAEDFQDHCLAVHWARKLVEAEPYDVTNWWSLDWAVEKLHGKSASVEILRDALKHYGPDYTLYYGLSSHLCALNRLDEAKEAMLLALKEDIFALKGALESETFAPIHHYIQELKESDWYKSEKDALEKRYPSEAFHL